MTIQPFQILKPKGTNKLDLVVTATGMTVYVQAGSFKIDGVDYTLEDNEQVTLAADDNYEMGFLGYLVFDQNNVVRILLDTVLKTGLHRSHSFQNDQTHKPIFPLFCGVLPPRCTDLANVVITVRQFNLYDTPAPQQWPSSKPKSLPGEPGGPGGPPLPN